MILRNFVGTNKALDNTVKSIKMKIQDEQTKAKVRFFRALLNTGFEDITKMRYSEKKYTERELSDYTVIMKRAFKKGTYIIDCDYGDVFIEIGERPDKKSYSSISDKLIALLIYLGGLKNKSSRYKFGCYRTKDINEVYDAVMTSYPYYKMTKVSKNAIEHARTQLPKILEEIKTIN